MRTHGQVTVLVVPLLCGALLAAGTAWAQDPGAPAPAAAAMPTAPAAPESWFGLYVGDGAYGYSVYAGPRLNQCVALEVGYLDSGTIGWAKNLVYTPKLNDFYNNRVDFQATVTEVSVLGILPFSDIWEVYLRLGAGFWEGQSTQRLGQSFGDIVVTRNVEDDGTGLDSFLLELQYRFGAH
jgi:hypothetical protein